MQSLLRDLWQSFHHARFWVFSAWLDIVASSRMSRMGILWLLLPSFLYIWGVGSFFALLQHHEMRDFAVYIAVGTIVFRLITGVIVESTTAHKASSSFIMDGHTRLSDFVLRVIAKAVFAFIMSLPAAAMAIAVYPHLSAVGLVLGIAALPLVLVNILWIGVVFSLIGARHPDFSHVVPNMFMFLYLLTPIIWSAQQMPPGSVRGRLVTWNPFYYLIETVRAPIMDGHYDVRALLVAGALAVVGWLVAILAYRRWARFVPIWI
ncbi:MAG TPA: ABC transporter permease [Rhodanobacteraceae bacterium]|nr:ABC transporter permease [Rhodanobacteraceae bacterium]